jgi:hypothetical protein
MKTSLAAFDAGFSVMMAPSMPLKRVQARLAPQLGLRQGGEPAAAIARVTET